MTSAWTLWLALMTSSITVHLSKSAPSVLLRTADSEVEDLSKQPWLADGTFYDIDQWEDHPQADGTGVTQRCPPTPKALPPGACDLAKCSSDRECQPMSLMCCWNGCVYTCLPEVLPAPYFDWIRQPRRRIKSGQSWLVRGPNSKTEVESCSTTPPDDDSDPLHCPHGYECVIDDPGNEVKGVPDLGHCVKTSDDVTDQDGMLFGSNIGVKAHRKSIPEEVPRNCKLDDGRMLLHGHANVFEGQKCLCKETKLLCTKMG